MKTSSEHVLTLSNVGMTYGSLHALSGVTFDVAKGNRHALIGPNGAGKSTLFNIIGGVERPTVGIIALEGQDITAWRPQRRSRAGIAKTFQHSSLFPTLTVEENVAIAVHCYEQSGARFWRPHRGYRFVRAQVVDALERVGLNRDLTARADELSHGECRQLELALAMCMQPRLLMLDEPVAGMSPAETASFVRLIKSLSREVTVLLVEHDLDVVMQLADRITVLDAGKVIADGSPEEVTSSPHVRDAYLGTSFSKNEQAGSPS